MSAYCLFDNIEVADADVFARYLAGVGPTVAAHGGLYLATGATPEVIEGEPVVHELVLIEFPDLAAAHAWYEPEQYRPLRDLRHAATRGTAVFFEAEPPTELPH